MGGSTRQAALVAAWLPLALMNSWLPSAAAVAQEARDDSMLLRAVNSKTRSPSFKARDGVRKPAQELAFFGLTADATVVEIWPGRGYWTEILAPMLAKRGKYYVALPPAKADEDVSPFQKKLADDPVLGKHVMVTGLLPGHLDDVKSGSVDFVVTFRNFHNWMAMGNVDEVLAAFHRVLKPGGILGVEDHRADPTEPQDPKADSGYVRQDYAIAAIEKAGFKLVESSEMNANPKDTRHYPKGVWTLPPTFALGKTDHAKYAAIGEADNFVLKFQKE